MKKIKLTLNQDLKPILEVIKQSGYSYVFSPSTNPTWLLVDEENKKVSFEYGDDAYDYPEVELDFLLEEKLTDLEYWKRRCVLLEDIEKNSPCDPDITQKQIESYENYHVFISKYGDKLTE